MVRLMRPGQWVKNLFVFLPMFFDGRLLDPESWVMSTVAFILFSLTAGAVYCFNDAKDANYDRSNPDKRTRPVASGAVSRTEATALGLVLIAVVAITVAIVPLPGLLHAGLPLTAYLLLNVAYTLWLKRIEIVDVATIAIGFVLRLYAGAAACYIWVSPWIVVLTFLLTMMLAVAKRRYELQSFIDSGVVSRRNIKGYNLKFLDMILGTLAAVTLVSYIIYSVSPDVETRLGSDHVYVTSVFVLLGIFRYLQLSLVDNSGGDPSAILTTDRFLQTCIVGWIASFIFIIYM